MAREREEGFPQVQIHSLLELARVLSPEDMTTLVANAVIGNQIIVRGDVFVLVASVLRALRVRPLAAGTHHRAGGRGSNACRADGWARRCAGPAAERLRDGSVFRGALPGRVAVQLSWPPEQRRGPRACRPAHLRAVGCAIGMATSAAGRGLDGVTPASRSLCAAALSDIRYDAFDERPLPSADISAEPAADIDGEWVPPPRPATRPLITGRPHARGPLRHHRQAGLVLLCPEPRPAPAIAVHSANARDGAVAGGAAAARAAARRRARRRTGGCDHQHLHPAAGLYVHRRRAALVAARFASAHRRRLAFVCVLLQQRCWRRARRRKRSTWRCPS